VEGRQFDFVFSFDSLVHADWDAVGHYVPQVVRLLAPGGLAFLHHSNLGAQPDAKVVGHRSTDVSPERVREAAERVGGKVLVQERISWTEEVLSDCFTLLGRADEWPDWEPVQQTNPTILGVESRLALDTYQHYLAVQPRRETGIGQSWRETSGERIADARAVLQTIEEFLVAREHRASAVARGEQPQDPAETFATPLAQQLRSLLR
jgi:hypothetical protein